MRGKLLNSIAETISDYREDEITVNSDHVEKWIQQFSDEAQTPILQEMDHVLKKTYFSKKATKAFLVGLFQTKALVGDDPCSFWKKAEMLDIQSKGSSQKEMVALFNKIVNTNCSFPGNSSSSSLEEFVYLDDGLFSGYTTLTDLKEWLKTKSPAKCKIHVVNIAQYEYGCYNLERNIIEYSKSLNKSINLKFWYRIRLENRLACTDFSDVLRPCSIPDDPVVKAYVNGMGKPPTLRNPGRVGNQAIFSSDQGRQLLEREFLLAGAKIRQMCTNLNQYQCPLGNCTFRSLGFGSLFATFRNCPNNAPLALWAGAPWYPLLPRKTNSETSFAKFKEMLDKTSLLW